MKTINVSINWETSAGIIDSTQISLEADEMGNVYDSTIITEEFIKFIEGKNVEIGDIFKIIEY